MSAGVLFEWALFLALSAVAIAGAAMMLLTMSMYRAGLFLMVSFLALAGMFFLLRADLLAVIQIMMNVGGMMIMILFMVMLMIDPGGEMMWDMKRQMKLPGPGAFSMSMPRGGPPEAEHRTGDTGHTSPDGSSAGTAYTCPMHPEIISASTGKCPKCGMDLVSIATAAEAAPATEFTCPMHPEIISGGAGKCPKCGMDLVPRANTDAAGTDHAAPDARPEPTVFTCPMHPDVRSKAPGKCPKCGMDLVPQTADLPAGSEATAGYTCAMHPDVRSDGPDKCPKCGMDLVPARPAAGTGPAVTEEVHGMTPAAHHQMMIDMAMSTEQLPWALGIGLLSAASLALLVVWTPWPTAPQGPIGDATSAVGELLLGRYMMAFEGAAMLILAGIVAGVLLGRRERGPTPARARDSEAGASFPPAQSAEAMHDGHSHPTNIAPNTVDTGSIWTCPMHPEVRSDGPGKCPKCGMDLVFAESLGTPGRVHGG